MTNDNKIDSNKLDQASGILKDMMLLAQNYNEIFKTLTPQEKHLSGGIVFRIHNVWNDFSLVGIMADRDMAGEMIARLVSFYQNPQQVQGINNNEMSNRNGKLIVND